MESQLIPSIVICLLFIILVHLLAKTFLLVVGEILIQGVLNLQESKHIESSTDDFNESFAIGSEAFFVIFYAFFHNEKC